MFVVCKFVCAEVEPKSIGVVWLVVACEVGIWSIFYSASLASHLDAWATHSETDRQSGK